MACGLRVDGVHRWRAVASAASTASTARPVTATWLAIGERRHTAEQTQVPGHEPALGINLQQPGSAQDAGTAPPPPNRRRRSRNQNPNRKSREPRGAKAYDQKQLA